MNNTIAHYREYDLFNEEVSLHINFDYLEIGNNYTLDHFCKFLEEQKKDVIAYVYNIYESLSDTIIFYYKGKYGIHKEVLGMNDFHDYFNHIMNN